MLANLGRWFLMKSLANLNLEAAGQSQCRGDKNLAEEKHYSRQRIIYTEERIKARAEPTKVLLQSGIIQPKPANPKRDCAT
jgi:hypothetical protein